MHFIIKVGSQQPVSIRGGNSAMKFGKTAVFVNFNIFIRFIVFD